MCWPGYVNSLIWSKIWNFLQFLLAEYLESRDLGVGVYFGLPWFKLVPRGPAKCGSERTRENWHPTKPSERNIFVSLISWASFFIGIQHGQGRGWNLSSEIACEILAAKLLTAGLAWTYWILTTFLANAASYRVKRDPSLCSYFSNAK